MPLLLALALTAGCTTPRVREFPLGIFTVPDAADLPELRQAGFSVVAGPATKSYLDAAQTAGLKVLTTPPAPSSTLDGLRKLDAHPALWTWCVIDEPDLQGVSPDTVRRLARDLRARGARKPTALTLYQGHDAFDYGSIPDVLILDRYPVPWLPLANFGQHVRAARLAIEPDKPLLAVIQAFDWTAYPGLLRTSVPLRPPTHAELRCMAYEALARGANGILFYEWDGPWKLRDHPEVWAAVRQVTAEIRAREPLFRGQRRWWAKEHDFADPATAFNAALESSVTATLLDVNAGNEAVPSGCYIVAVNNTPANLEYSFRLPAETATLPVLGKDRTLAPLHGRVTDRFAPYAVHVYGPLSATTRPD